MTLLNVGIRLISAIKLLGKIDDGIADGACAMSVFRVIDLRC